MGNNFSTGEILRIDRGRIVFFDRRIESQVGKNVVVVFVALEYLHLHL